MKKILLAVTLAFAASSAQAEIVGALGGLKLTNSTISGLTVSTGYNETVVPSDGGWGAIGGSVGFLGEGAYTAGAFGQLTNMNAGATVSFTFLGKVAGFNNYSQGDAFANNEGSFVGGQRWDDTNVGSQAAITNVGAGERVRFGFNSSLNSDASAYVGAIANGGVNQQAFGIMFFDASVWNAANPDKEQFDFLIGYNDPSDTNADYDDYVLGVKAVPVPAALPLMASALGMFGIARRRKTLA